MDSDEASARSLNAYVKRFVVDILRATGVRRGNGSLGELHSSDETEVKKRYPYHARNRRVRNG